jgi:predicted nucleotidyltransferase
MISRGKIQEVVDHIVREFRPERIILFGSYAYGTVRPDSDIDLLVVMPFRGNPLRKSLEILSRVKPMIPVDLVVRTPEQVRRRLAWNDFLLQEATAKGSVLYEAPDA